MPLAQLRRSADHHRLSHNRHHHLSDLLGFISFSSIYTVMARKPQFHPMKPQSGEFMFRFPPMKPQFGVSRDFSFSDTINFAICVALVRTLIFVLFLSFHNLSFSFSLLLFSFQYFCLFIFLCVLFHSFVQL